MRNYGIRLAASKHRTFLKERARSGAALAIIAIALTTVATPQADLATAVAGERRVSTRAMPAGGVTSQERFLFYSKRNPAVGIENTSSPHSVDLLMDAASAHAGSGYFYDGSGWVSDAPIATTDDWWGASTVIPAGRTLVLPKGIYTVSAYVDYVGDVGDGNIGFFWYSAAPLAGDELGQAPYYLPGFPGGAVSSSRDGFFATGILAHFDDTPVPFVFRFSAYPATPGLSIQDYSFMVQKIGNVA